MLITVWNPCVIQVPDEVIGSLWREPGRLMRVDVFIFAVGWWYSIKLIFENQLPELNTGDEVSPPTQDPRISYLRDLLFAPHRDRPTCGSWLGDVGFGSRSGGVLEVPQRMLTIPCRGGVFAEQ
ncbi:hypothetical protein NDU88_000980 [Pleurodeles waltl]|uniref:Uncharacterized protein n=1 Tax=Pleurodeles waltl TaxID=8319 RepID=A0AAV7TGZ9_PLEWA|nr:hypothetical protein NDU88_000980 [Pleurodeles waltl]